MKIELMASCCSLTEQLRKDILQRLERTLQRYRVWVEQVEVQLGEVRGAPGTARKFCRVAVRFPRMPPVVITGVGNDLDGVFGTVADQVGKTVGGRISRRNRTKRRFGLQSVRSGRPPGVIRRLTASVESAVSVI